MQRWMISASLMLAMAPMAQAEPVTVGDGWHPFFFEQKGTAWLDSAINSVPAPAPITFELDVTTRSYLQVTDVALAGDRFRVELDGTLLGLTSIPTGGAADDAGADFDAAFAAPTWSNAQYVLSAGHYLLTGLAIASPYDAGMGGVQLVAASEPGALLLLAAGIVGLGASRRLQRKP